MEGLQKVVRLFLDADDSPISHQNIIITFWPIYDVLEICMQVYSMVFALTSKKYAKIVNLICAGSKVFVKDQAQGDY